MGDPNRETPMIALRVQLPGKPSPERIAALEDTPGNASRVAKLTFEDNDKAVDKAKIEINNYDLRFPDDRTFDRGNTLFLQWGYAGNMSPVRELVIVDWTPGPTFMVEAHAKSTLMNRVTVDQTYYGKTFSDVAKIIADRNGYASSVQQIQVTKFVVEAMVQAHQTDGQFLREIAKDLGYVFFADNSGFHFHERGYSQKSSKTLTYFSDGRGELKAFPTFEKAPAAQPGAVTLKAIDPKTKKRIEERGDNKTTAGRPGLASQMEVYDKKTSVASLRPNVGREVTAPGSGSPEEIKSKAQALAKKSLGVPVKCTAPCMGDPQFAAKTVVTLNGIGQRLSGNYYCPQATHSVAPGNYDMSLKLVRDGTNGSGGPGSAGAASAAKTNTSQGPAGSSGSLVATETPDPRTGGTTTSFAAPGAKKN